MSIKIDVPLTFLENLFWDDKELSGNICKNCLITAVKTLKLEKERWNYP